jgi:serine/threonine protein kinase
MGEVWRAKDTKLGREVAIKTLPEEFAGDPNRLARFEREAKPLASLNHPNIAAIHGFEEYEGSRFLVLELVEGDTLADGIARGAIPVDESLQLALQIAEALEVAHEKGVIHRDLKPANIKVTPDGKVKVLDFGLAKACAASDTSVSQSPTISMTATRQGVILGTAAYTSPEQARGQEVDKRTDIWALGCLLFEMLSGQATFPVTDVTDSLAAVVRAEPQWDSLPANLNPKLNELLKRCLEKDARNRWHDIADVRINIETVQANPDDPTVDSQSAAKAYSPRTLTWGIAFARGVVVAGLVAWYLAPPSVVVAARFEPLTKIGA